MPIAATKRMENQPAFFSAQVSDARRFYLDLNPPALKPLVVVCGGSEHCAPDYRVERLDFPYYSIEFVARGEGSIRIRGQEHRLTPGSLFAYGPGVGHDISCNPRRPLVKHFVDFVGTRARRQLREAVPEELPVVQTSSPEQVLQLFDDLTTAGLRYTRFTPRICTAILEQLILRIAETTIPAGVVGTLAFETYQRCREHIESNYLQLQQVNDIAKACRVDPAYLCRLFGRYDDQSPYQYLTLLRMRHAARLLESPGLLVKEVAAELQFSDQFQFSRTFRRVFGISPRQFMQLLPGRRQ